MSTSATTKKRRQRTEYELGQITGLLKAGIESPTEISRILEMPESTIRDAIARWKSNGTTLYENTRTGRPPAVSDREKRYLARK